MHANDVPSVIQRLQTLGCSRSVIAQSLSLVMVQRLVRRLCPACAKTDETPDILIESMRRTGLYDPSNPIPVARAHGCQACNFTGLSGRVAVIESMRFSEEQRAMLMAERPLHEIMESAAAARGLIRFNEYARFLMWQHFITPAEALLTVAE
jgi:type II secretory ATPase GspE/PulE/Tfp pilus assembly ATPase PilB-like protein